MEASEQETLERLRQLRDELRLRRAMQAELAALEDELCTSNRFFPRTNILSWVDAIAPMVTRTLPSGSTLYRARIVAKAQEDRFFAPVYHALEDALGAFARDGERGLDNESFAEAYLQLEIERLESGLPMPDFDVFKRKLAPFQEKGWWGFGQDESDAAPSDVTGSGRINPKGISYLYASSRKGTAALEARPVISQMVSIAEVVLCEEVTLFDLTRNVFADDESASEETRMFRKILAHYFSKPNYSGDSAYLVTQYISEYVKGRIETSTGLRFDGISFSSSLDRKGTNYVVFDTSERRKYQIVASSIERVTDMRGTLSTSLPMDDAAIRALMNGSL
ncbi:MAG: RES family NAD+ phosphorylase [Atopobiaceae bacterium]|nr:RES family NAD+ phosphorylase [Atopobiaceae bacterium]